MSRKIICITGATGFIGNHLINRISNKKYSIRVLTRNLNHEFPDNTEVFFGDLTFFDYRLKLFLDNCSILINCAGEIHNPSIMSSLHVGGVLNLLKAISEDLYRIGPPLHWVQLSSVGAYGPQVSKGLDRLVNEVTPQYPVGEYEITKKIADDLVMKANNEGVITCSILRPTNVFGKGMRNQSLNGLIRVIEKGFFFYIGKPGAISSYVHVDDVVEGIISCAFNPMAKGKTFILSADCMLEDLVLRIASTLGKSAPSLRLPEPLVRRFVQHAKWLNLLPLTSSRIDALTCRTRYSSHRIFSDLDFSLSRPMPNSIVDLIDN
jgi:nucleoside-diphosphate-sugar epimerase